LPNPKLCVTQREAQACCTEPSRLIAHKIVQKIVDAITIHHMSEEDTCHSSSAYSAGSADSSSSVELLPSSKKPRISGEDAEEALKMLLGNVPSEEAAQASRDAEAIDLLSTHVKMPPTPEQINHQLLKSVDRIGAHIPKEGKVASTWDDVAKDMLQLTGAKKIGRTWQKRFDDIAKTTETLDGAIATKRQLSENEVVYLLSVLAYYGL